MEFRNYDSLKGALSDILRKDADYYIVRHELKKGKGINRHYHPKANEWLIIDSGKFEVRIDDKRESFNVKNKIHVFKFMVSVKHAFYAASDISYFVIRDVEDETIFSNNIF